MHLDASHEIGHYLIGRPCGFSVKSISIINGAEYQPITNFSRASSEKQNIEFSLAGWAGEAYTKAHFDEPSDFRLLYFLLGVITSSQGSGRPKAFFVSGKNDLSDLLNEGVEAWRLILPFNAVLRAGRIIHEERELFWRLVERLEISPYLCERALLSLWSAPYFTGQVG